MKIWLWIWLLVVAVWADDTVEEQSPAMLTQGSSFFLLSDAVYGSNDMAKVRVETDDGWAMEEYGGVDIYVYKIDKPLDFLKAQKNLHRIDTTVNYKGEGLANALALIWDEWWDQSRRWWRSLFSANARGVMTREVPQIRTHPRAKDATILEHPPHYAPLKGYNLHQSFRYPLTYAKPIQPPKGVKLAGSSSNFIEAHEGNVMIPLGKLTPGLYLVEAVVGDYRANTLVFVSDSVAITKIAREQMGVWVASRTTSKPIANATVMWSDGIGVLEQGQTDTQGWKHWDRKSPQKSYLYGQDPQGGVYISENFYYDSEIYNQKIYALTDRPLYRPGDTLSVQFIGRHFLSSSLSQPLKGGTLQAKIVDPSGMVIAQKTILFDPQSGANTTFKLPSEALSGGYEIRFGYGGKSYGAAFRVSEYQKPHFEVSILPQKPQFKTNEKVKGMIQLSYPDGKPVANATVEMEVRAQRLSMIEGDLGYTGMFPLRLLNTVFVTDAKGQIAFELPAAKSPSRYILSTLATDGAAYRVRATKELLIERGFGSYEVSGAMSFSTPSSSVHFQYHSNDEHPSAIARWRARRLEDGTHITGALSSDGFDVSFERSGSYWVFLEDAEGNILGGTTHYVSGDALKTPQGSIRMVFDQNSYPAGGRAKALITFPEAVDEALLSLERDRVEQHALLTQGGDWITTRRLSPKQWEVELPVYAQYGPNITLSIAYVKGGEYVFQNLGLKVDQPRINVTIQADKREYRPGDTVTLSIHTSLGAQALPNTRVSVGVVDEMVYVLQPEIVPNIVDFFYHPRRNNVRTSASLSFIGYDLARPPLPSTLPAYQQTPQRAIKLQERPRRDDKDTALWSPSLITDAHGDVKVQFVMPDALTRWRVSARAIDPKSGLVGQERSYLVSNKPLYLKWTSPTWFREGDKPTPTVAIFNQTSSVQTADLTFGIQKRSMSVQPGANFVTLQSGDVNPSMRLQLLQNNTLVDALTVPLKVIPARWLNRYTLTLPLNGQVTPLALPKDATSIKLQLGERPEDHIRRIMDDLIDYPYGCVEQSASRMIPYALALEASDEGAVRDVLRDRLYAARLRLAHLAGPQATFGWWSAPSDDGDLFVSAYAYYADWSAARALGITLAPNHFDKLLDLYASQAPRQSSWRRALILDWMQQMGLPVRSIAQATLDEMLRRNRSATKVSLWELQTSWMMDRTHTLQDSMATLLLGHILRQSGAKLSDTALVAMTQATTQLNDNRTAVGDALLLLDQRRSIDEANTILEQLQVQLPTIDRAVSLVWVMRALHEANRNDHTMSALAVENPWRYVRTLSGGGGWHWGGKEPPQALRLTTLPPSTARAIVQYESVEENATSTLPLTIERRLYRLSQNKLIKTKNNTLQFNGMSNYIAQPLSDTMTLTTNDLYIDEITIQNRSATPLHFGMLQIPLPPGMVPDMGTWGINVGFGKGRSYSPLEKGSYQLIPQGYTIGIDHFRGKRVYRHLVRASQKGEFVVPEIRYYAMYQSTQKAFEAKPRGRFTIR